MWLGVFPPDISENGRYAEGPASLSPLAALEREISKTCKPFRPTQYWEVQSLITAERGKI